MKPGKTAVGDIVLIPLAQGFRPAKVLYVSQRYKDTLLLGLYATTVNSVHMPADLPDGFGLTLYTSKAPIRTGRWLQVGNQALTAPQRGLDRRIVANELWQGDEHLGPASAQDQLDLPQMLVMGAGLVEKKAQALLATAG
ncbi:hypothetical protein [Pseudomonas sp. CF161]|uniref:hypothetical protein n=1 Tax=Pseudomonas sp. CF161 TaxID=911241 RepID=UPI000354F9AE|nr:hypothetical protein [Pseudomonas sp. CF161]EPL07186.1 hypothetical protein CF161_18299 [Pseudomonas sp. CF161]